MRIDGTLRPRGHGIVETMKFMRLLPELSPQLVVERNPFSKKYGAQCLAMWSTPTPARSRRISMAEDADGQA